ncbi:uroporphyrinogen-III synthase [Ferruginibacter sp. HRS2-29]|uniref:uroporphyrinogen-III synthase n=1 Tax=Ferruginibacter sp. HRS2-29 TaxID=2487334 RepID=UPI0020CD842E|nr:uroporphyrinogen-III synthase [Ferruginibacter sp. HRS2-29]
MENSIHILCTRHLDAQLVESAAAKNILIEEISFIATEPVKTVEVQQEIEYALSLSATVVFTSMNAVEAVATFLLEDDMPDWRIYCIGNTTRQLAKKYFGDHSIAGFAEDAVALAELIVEEGDAEEVVFFCGNKRRDELPDFLRSNDIAIDEITVYETFEVNHKISKDYHGILFFSPSAVESFFANNKSGERTIFFAIGKTTASAIRKFTGNRILLSDEPGKENLVMKMMEYFSG